MHPIHYPKPPKALPPSAAHVASLALLRLATTTARHTLALLHPEQPTRWLHRGQPFQARDHRGPLPHVRMPD